MNRSIFISTSALFAAGCSSGSAVVPPARTVSPASTEPIFFNGGSVTPTASGSLVGKLDDGATFAANAPIGDTMTVRYVLADGTSGTLGITRNSDGSAVYSDDAGHRLNLAATDIQARAARTAQQISAPNIMGGSTNGYTFFGTAIGVAGAVLLGLGIAAGGPIGLIGLGIGVYGYFSGKG
jgi:hypothetical protein